MCFDTSYNKCTIVFTNTTLFMNDILTCQLIEMVVTTKPMSVYGTENHPYVNTQNKKNKANIGQSMKTQRKEDQDDDNYLNFFLVVFMMNSQLL